MMATSLGLLGGLHYHRYREVRLLKALLEQNEIALEEAELQIDILNRFVTDFVGRQVSEIKPKNLH